MIFRKLRENSLSASARNDAAEAIEVSAAQVGDAAEGAQQFLRGERADARNVVQGGTGLALAAAQTVEGDGEAMGFVADLLDEVEDRGVAVEHARLVFTAVNVKDFFFFCDAGQRLIDDLQGFESLGGGAKLADATVDEDQTGHGFLFFLEEAVTAEDGFVHAGEIVVLARGDLREVFADGEEFDFFCGE